MRCPGVAAPLATSKGLDLELHQLGERCGDGTGLVAKPTADALASSGRQ